MDEPISVKFFVDFGDYFGRFSLLFRGVISTFRILPPEKEAKIGSKEPQNRLKLFTEIGSGDETVFPLGKGRVLGPSPHSHRCDERQ